MEGKVKDPCQGDSLVEHCEPSFSLPKSCIASRSDLNNKSFASVAIQYRVLQWDFVHLNDEAMDVLVA